MQSERIKDDCHAPTDIHPSFRVKTIDKSYIMDNSYWNK
jgi:hypothetical protein